MDPSALAEAGPWGIVVVLAGAVGILFRALMESQNGRLADRDATAQRLYEGVAALRDAVAALKERGRRDDR